MGRIPGFLQSIVVERLRGRRITDVAGMIRFVQTRAAYTAQTALYAYLKARMGTSFQRYFEDEKFSRVIRDAAIKYYVSCLADLTIYAAAIVGQDNRLEDTDTAALARHCYRQARSAGIDHLPDIEVPADTIAAFNRRTETTVWAAATVRDAAFVGSTADLLRFAPVVDAFKEEDAEPVTNSIRFRWRNLREQLRNRFDAAAIAEDWRRKGGDAA